MYDCPELGLLYSTYHHLRTPDSTYSCVLRVKFIGMPSCIAHEVSERINRVFSNGDVQASCACMMLIVGHHP